MPKKSHSAKAKRHARAVKPIEAKHSQTVKPQSPVRTSQVKTSHEVQDLVSRYHYVMPEVKRIGILAGSIIVVLIILSFVL
jgi:hypothetical protein